MTEPALYRPYAEQVPDRHEARLQDHEKRLVTLGSQPLGYLPEAQALSMKPTQSPHIVRSDTETCSIAAPKSQESHKCHGFCISSNSPSPEACETQLQYTIEVSQTHRFYDMYDTFAYCASFRMASPPQTKSPCNHPA